MATSAQTAEQTQNPAQAKLLQYGLTKSGEWQRIKMRDGYTHAIALDKLTDAQELYRQASKTSKLMKGNMKSSFHYVLTNHHPALAAEVVH